mgnify:CR=1 FL=1
MGVPASVIFEGAQHSNTLPFALRFSNLVLRQASSRPTACHNCSCKSRQFHERDTRARSPGRHARGRLNTTVTSMALAVNKVLTAWCAALAPPSSALAADAPAVSAQLPRGLRRCHRGRRARAADGAARGHHRSAGALHCGDHRYCETTLERTCNAKLTFHASRRSPRSPPRCTRWAARPSRSRARSSAAARRTRTTRTPR